MSSEQISADTIEAFQNGNMDAFRVIYDETKNMVYSIAQKLVRDGQDIEDLMHDVYLRVYEQRKRYSPKKAKFTTWAYRVALNHAINMTKRRRWSFIDIDIDKLIPQKNEEPDGLDRIINGDNALLVDRALKKIPVKYRICLVMKEIEELPYQEIADMLGISIGTVRSRIHRAKKAVKEILDKGQYT